MKRLSAWLCFWWCLSLSAFAQLAPLGSTGPISVTSSSTATALGSTAGATAFVCNIGGNIGYVLLGKTNAVTVSTATGIPIPAGGCVNLFSGGQSWIAAISASGTTIVVISGNGAADLRVAPSIAGGPPSGNAGGGLSGTYPNPTVNLQTGGGTVNGNLTIGSANALVNDGAAGTNRLHSFETGGLLRWSLGAGTGAESGGNVGSDFEILNWSDAGALLGVPIIITRSTGLVTLGDGLTVTGAETVNGGFTINPGTTTFAGSASNANALFRTTTNGITGTVSSGTQPYGQIGPTGGNDTAVCPSSNGGCDTMKVDDILGAAATGNRWGVDVTVGNNADLTAGTAFLGGIRSTVQTAFDLGANATIFAANFSAALQSRSGANNALNGLVTQENDISVATGVTAPLLKEGFKIVQTSTDKVAGTNDDAAITLNNQSAQGTPPGWNCGLCFGGYEGYFPIASTGTLIGIKTHSGGTETVTANYGINIAGPTYTTAAYKDGHVQIDGSGVMTGASIAATQLTGTVPTAQMPKGAITQLAAGISGSITVTNGGAATNNVGDVLTLNDGCSGTVNGVVQAHAKLNVASVTGGPPGTVATVTINTAGVCVIPPVNPVGVLSSTGSDTTSTYTIGNLNWIGTYTITQARFRMCEIGAGAGAGGVSNINGANAAPGSAGTWLCALYVNQTVGGTINYNLGIGGLGATAGANNGNNGTKTAFGTIGAPGGNKGAGSSSGSAAAASVNAMNTGAILPVAVTTGIIIESESIPLAAPGQAGGSQGISSPWGTGGAGGANANGTSATSTVCGAGGGAPSSTQTSVSYSGGNGSGGCIFVETDS